jgi:hypothetical protein
MLKKLHKNNASLNPKNFWAITSYYNPFHGKARLENYHNFKKNLNLPLITVEWSLENKFELTSESADVVIQVSGGGLMWQKERLLNIALDHLPPHCDFVAWLDCDIVFQSHQWSEDAEDLLNKHDVIQLFEEVIYLKANKENSLHMDLIEHLPCDHIFRSSMSEMYKGHYRLDTKSTSSSPGLAFAAKKEWILSVGFYDAGIVGGGDCLFFHALHNLSKQFFLERFFSNEMIKHFNKWLKKMPSSTRCSYLPTTIYHLYHGQLENRGYFTREQILAKLNFDPQHHLTITTCGLYDWSPESFDIKTEVFKYLRSRQDS